MEILQFLISFFLEEYKDSNFAPILCHLKDNGFDLRRAFSSLKPDMVAPVIRAFMQGINKNTPTETVGQDMYDKPILNFADKEIVNNLNRYFNQSV
ncbi:MAG: hypothetical protein IJZ73_05110 [Clostridia bacterium]|nr:hypothetical protein [Clostridia bacterium]